MKPTPKKATLVEQVKQLGTTRQEITFKLKFHEPFTLAEAADLVRQAKEKRDALVVEFREQTGNPPPDSADLYPEGKRGGLRTVGAYYGQLKHIAKEMEELRRAIDQARRGMGIIHSEYLWELAESLGLSYPTVELDS